MRTRLIITGIVVLLAIAIVPAAWAGPHRATTKVSGDWSWVNTSWEETVTAGGNKLMTGDEVGTWTGTFKGTSYDVFAMTAMPPFDYDNNLYGAGWGTLTCSFTGKVAGKKGSMMVFFTIEEPANDPVMTGHWVIVCGTEGLARLSGRGTWVSSGVDNSAKYKGRLAWK
jgi:hypothetical protein